MACTVVAECYKYASGDTFAVFGTTAASGYPVANAKDPNLMFIYKCADKDDQSGLSVELAATMPVYGAEAVNVELAATEDVQMRMHADAFATLVVNTGFQAAVPTEVYTSHTQLTNWQPTRPNWILGVDNFDTGPTPATTPVPAPITVKTCLVTFLNAVAARTVWETAFLALAVKARPINVDAGGAVEGSIQSTVVKLRGGGHGYQWEMSWPRLPMDDVTYLRSVEIGTEGGDWPFFLWPFPGQKSTGGVITGERYSPATRGGLARLISFEASEQELVGSEYYGINCRLVAQSWQEVPTNNQ